MFKIGDFSRLTRVPIKTLRHYDEIELFKPAQVDSFTSYRYYTFDQLPRLNRILALKGLGFTLEHIKQMLDEPLNSAELRGMLRLRRAQLEQQVDDTLEKLAQVEIRLRQIEQEGKMPEVDVLVKQVEPLTLVGAREVVLLPAQMRERCIALNSEACTLIESAGLKTNGVSLALYYNGGDRGIDVEMAYAVESAPGVHAESGKAALHTISGAAVAYAVYRGSYADFGAVGQVHGAIAHWIQNNGYQISGACREFYLSPPQNADNPTGVMEIQYPVQKA